MTARDEEVRALRRGPYQPSLFLLMCIGVVMYMGLGLTAALIWYMQMLTEGR